MISDIDIHIEPIDSTNKMLIDNLWQFYELESSFYSKADVDASGRFTSLSDFLAHVDSKYAFSWGYIVRYQAQIAGFLIISDDFLDGKPIREFSDIYVLPKYRGLGIATQLISTVIFSADHPWLICAFRADNKAVNFWRNVFERLPFDSVSENSPPEIADLHEFIINDRTGIHSK